MGSSFEELRLQIIIANVAAGASLLVWVVAVSHRIEYGRALFPWLRSRRLRSLENASAICRVRAVWALNGRSRIDSFDDDNRPAEPYGYALVSTDAGLGCCYADDFLEVPPD